MRTSGSYAIERKYGTLAHAQAKLVKFLGGHEKAGKVAGLSTGHIQRCTSPNDKRTNLPLRCIEKMEATCNKYPVTEYLASKANLLLVQLSPVKTKKKWLKHAAVIAKEFGELLQKIAEFLEDDGDINEKEARVLLKEANDCLQVMADLKLAVEMRIEQGKKSSAA